jgi:hypothetical protein
MSFRIYPIATAQSRPGVTLSYNFQPLTGAPPERLAPGVKLF